MLRKTNWKMLVVTGFVDGKQTRGRQRETFLTYLCKMKSTFTNTILNDDDLHNVDAKSHPSPRCPLCNTLIHNIHHLFNCTHRRTTLSPLTLWTDHVGVTTLLARWTVNWLVDLKREDRSSPTSKG